MKGVASGRICGVMGSLGGIKILVINEISYVV